MRIISGRYKEKKIALVKGVEIRPTMGKVREALFNILLHSRLVSKLPEEMRFLDLFAGSASVGIEALSRGFASVTVVDIDTRCARANLEKLAISEKVTILDRDIANLDDSVMQYDVAFMDPPYSDKASRRPMAKVIEKSFSRLHEGGWLREGSVVILEKQRKELFELKHHAFKLVEQRRYGMSELFIFAYMGDGSLPVAETV